jgi:hypothetical protein
MATLRRRFQLSGVPRLFVAFAACDTVAARERPFEFKGANGLWQSAGDPWPIVWPPTAGHRPHNRQNRRSLFSEITESVSGIKPLPDRTPSMTYF